MAVSNDRTGPSSPTFVAAGAVVVPVELAEPLWLAMRAWIRDRQRDGGRLKPGVQELADMLRAATLAMHLGTDANGPDSRPAADLDPHSATSAGILPTEAAAGLLGVSVRHVRRLAAAEGIKPIRRNHWAREDIEGLVARRRL